MIKNKNEGNKIRPIVTMLSLRNSQKETIQLKPIWPKRMKEIPKTIFASSQYFNNEQILFTFNISMFIHIIRESCLAADFYVNLPNSAFTFV